jgi:flagellar hook assembly protein FlgD
VYEASQLSSYDRLLPNSYKMYQNYPNPFNPITTFRYGLPEDGLVNITIYNTMGRIVKNLVNRQENAGYKSIQWNSINNEGKQISAGLYFYTIETEKFSQTKKMILLK